MPGCPAMCPAPAHMATACSVCCVGIVSPPVVSARMLKGRSSPLCIFTTHSCIWELCRNAWGGISE